MTTRFDRRRFLAGAGGAVLALPMLQSLLPRAAFGQTVTAPKRLVVVVHRHGRVAGNGASGQDNWSPATSTGPLPATLSPMLAALAPIRNELVTVDGVDNLVRHTTGDADGHYSAAYTFLTCARPTASGTATGPSLDYVAGQRLRASASQRTALVLPGSPLAFEYQYDAPGFFGAGGTPPALLHSSPKVALVDPLGPPTPAAPAPQKTLLDRLVARRASLLDQVADEYEGLRPKVTAADRERLDQHAAFIRALEARFAASPPPAKGQACVRPSEAQIPAFTASQVSRGRMDGQLTPWQIENLVMALACDVTRVASLHSETAYDPVYASEFAGASPFDGAANYHAIVHNTPTLSSPSRGDLTQAFQYHAKMFALLVSRLAAVPDVDGRRLLDNTLVLWVSDMGYGSAHYDFNIPVVLAGMKDAFPKGQGRHVVHSTRRSLGDLYAQVLRMLGGTDTTFGATGTVGSVANGAALNAWSGYPGFVKATTPLHLGPLDL